MNPYERQKYSFLALRAKFSRSKLSEKFTKSPNQDHIHIHPNILAQNNYTKDTRQSNVIEHQAEEKPTQPLQNLKDPTPDEQLRQDTEPRQVESKSCSLTTGSCSLHFETETSRPKKRSSSKLLFRKLDEPDVEAGESPKPMLDVVGSGSSGSLKQSPLLKHQSCSKLTTRKPSLSICKRKRRLHSLGVSHPCRKPSNSENQCVNSLSGLAEGGCIISTAHFPLKDGKNDPNDVPIWLEPTQKDEILLPKEYCCYQLPFIATTTAYRLIKPTNFQCTPLNGCNRALPCPNLPPPRCSPPPPPPLYACPRHTANNCPCNLPPVAFPPKQPPQCRMPCRPRSTRRCAPAALSPYSVMERDMVGTNLANDCVCQTPSPVRSICRIAPNVNVAQAGAPEQGSREFSPNTELPNSFNPRPEDHLKSQSVVNIRVTTSIVPQNLPQQRGVQAQRSRTVVEQVYLPNPVPAGTVQAQRSRTNVEQVYPPKPVPVGTSTSGLNSAPRVPSRRNLRARKSRSRTKLVDRQCTTYSSCGTQSQEAAKLIGSACERRTKSGHAICSVTRLNLSPPPPPRRPRLPVKKRSSKVCVVKKGSNLKLKRVTSKISCPLVPKASFGGQASLQSTKCCCCCCSRRKCRRLSRGRSAGRCSNHKKQSSNAETSCKYSLTGGSCGRHVMPGTGLNPRPAGRKSCPLCEMEARAQCQNACCPLPPPTCSAPERECCPICSAAPAPQQQCPRQPAGPTCPMCAQEASAMESAPQGQQTQAAPCSCPAASAQIPPYAFPRPSAPACNNACALNKPVVQPLSLSFTSSNIFLPNAAQNPSQTPMNNLAAFPGPPYNAQAMAGGLNQAYMAELQRPMTPRAPDAYRESLVYGLDPRIPRISFAPTDTFFRLSQDYESANNYMNALSQQQRWSMDAARASMPPLFFQENGRRETQEANRRQGAGSRDGKSSTPEQQRSQSRMTNQKKSGKSGQQELIYETDDPDYFSGKAEGADSARRRSSTPGSKTDLNQFDDKDNAKMNRKSDSNLLGRRASRSAEPDDTRRRDEARNRRSKTIAQPRTSKTDLEQRRMSDSNNDQPSDSDLQQPRPSRSHMDDQKRARSPSIAKWRRASNTIIEKGRASRRQSKPDLDDNRRKPSSKTQVDSDPYSARYSMYPNPRMSYAADPTAHIDPNRFSVLPNGERYVPPPPLYRNPYILPNGYPNIGALVDPLYFAPPPYGPMMPTRPPGEFLDPAVLQSLLQSSAPPLEPRAPTTTLPPFLQTTNFTIQSPDAFAPMPAGDCMSRVQCPCCGAVAEPNAVKPQPCGAETQGTNGLPDLNAAQMTQLFPGCAADGTKFFIVPLYSNSASGGACGAERVPDRCQDMEKKLVSCKKKKATCKKISKKLDMMRVQGHACNANGCCGNNDCWCCPCRCNPCPHNGCSGFSGGCS